MITVIIIVIYQIKGSVTSGLNILAITFDKIRVFLSLPET